MSTNQTRRPPGTPAGGQFASSPHARPSFELGADPTPASPDDPARWSEVGFSAREARLWGLATDGDPAGRIEPEEARSWSSHGFRAIAAGSWRRAGFEPGAAQSWAMSGFEPAGERSRQARAWVAAGFDPDEASRWRLASFEPSEAAHWRLAGFGYGTAAAWADAGVSVGEAREHLSERRFMPADAGM